MYQRDLFTYEQERDVCGTIPRFFVARWCKQKHYYYVLKSLVRFDITKVITVPSGRIMNVLTMESWSVIDRCHWNKKVSLLVVLEEKFGESLIVKFYSGPKCWTNHTIGSAILKVPWEHSYVPRILWFSGHMLLGSHVSKFNILFTYINPVVVFGSHLTCFMLNISEIN